ncbi:hypothetical protein [Silvanigrella aquatica]|uniref:hypothetical protein n=1 Tax=Silvanigrella aquatica TaxID=1915309 RepID=UPI0011E5E214|nr:hypothetical protein [Silvanigrella aquatica]
MKNMFNKFLFIVFNVVIMFFIFFIDTKVYADENQEKKSLVHLNNNEYLMNQIENRTQACDLLKNKVVTYIDLVFYVKKCKLMPIKDPEITNSLIQIQKKSLISLSDKVYSMMEMGKNYTFDEYYTDYNADEIENLKDLCMKFNKNIVTADAYSFYYIDACKKRLFKKYSDISFFKTKSKPVFSIKPRELSIFPTGQEMVVNKNDQETSMKVSETYIKENLPPLKNLCANLERKVVAFHASFFFLENCKLYKIDDFNITIQKKADMLGGVKELNIKQAIGIPQVGKIKSDDVLAKMR